MPVRYIATRLQIEGEREYRQAVTNINSELKVLDSGLKLVASQFRENANSQEALAAKGDVLQKMYDTQAEKVKALKDGLQNAGTAASGYANKSDELRKAIEANNQKLNELKNSSGDTAAEQQKLTEENKKLSAELERSNKSLDVASKTVNSWQTDLNKAEANLNDLSGELEKNNKYLKEAEASADGTAASIDQYGKTVETASEKNQKLGQGIEALSAILIAAGVQRSLKEIGEALMSCVDASAEFESGFAGVKKTVDGTDEELEKLKNGIKNMSLEIPLATSEINSVAEAAGQLGIKVADIESFTRVMLDLGVSTNLSAADAASTLAKFANITQMSSDDYERLGSVIVALGNNFATTESDIVSMATRLASTGAVVGLSEPQIMAIATALSSVGIEAEAGGSAISRLLKLIETSVQTYGKANEAIDATGYSLRELELMSANNSKEFKALADSMGLTSTELNKYVSNAKKLEQFADIAGVTADQFIQAWGDDAVLALDSFIMGLSGLEGTGTSAIEVLNDLGLTDVRLSNAVLALSSSNGILTDSLNLANAAWEENTALAKEAEQRYATTESKFQIFKNSVDNLKIAIGDDLNPTLGDLADTGTDVTKFMTELIQKNSGIVPGITALTAALGIFAGTITVTAAALKIYAIAKDLAFPVGGVVVAGIMAVVAGLTTLLTVLPKTTDSFDELQDKYKKINKESDELIQKTKQLKEAYQTQSSAVTKNGEVLRGLISDMEALSEKENKSIAEKEILKGIIREINNAIPEASLVYNENTDAIETNTGEILKNADAIKKLAEIKIKQEKYDAAVNNYTEALKKQHEIQQQVEETEKAIVELRIKDGELLNKYAEQEYMKDPLSKWFEYRLGIGEVNKEYSKLSDKLVELKTTYSDNQVALWDMEKAIDEIATSSNNAAGGVDNLNNSLEDTVPAVDSAGESIGDLAEDKLKSLEEAYESVYESARSSIEGQNKLFADQPKVTAKSVDEMLASLKQQYNDMTEYTLSLNKAVAIGFNSDFVAMLADGSAQSRENLKSIMIEYYDLIAKFGAGSYQVRAFVDKFNNEFKKTEDAKDILAKTMTEMETGLKKGTDGMIKTAEKFSDGFVEAITPDPKEISTSVYKATTDGITYAVNTSIKDVKKTTIDLGYFVSQGIAEGIKSGEGEVGKSMAYITSAMEKAFRNTNFISSPSKLYEKLAGYIPEGIALGLRNKADSVKQAMAELSENMEKAYSESGLNSASFEIPAFVRDIDSRSSSAAYGYADSLSGSGDNGHGGDTWNLYFDTINFKDLDDLMRIAKEKRLNIRMGYEKG